jgi:hypothetical protein
MRTGAPEAQQSGKEHRAILTKLADYSIVELLFLVNFRPYFLLVMLL